MRRRRSLEHPSSVSALRADPPSPTRGEGRSRLRPKAGARDCGPPVVRRPRGGPAAAAAVRPVSETNRPKAEPATAGRRSSGAPAEGQPRQRRCGP
ncbi:hypothetical protein EOA29_31265 [Mesorhizobium sp. M1E.F.Ca.ET.063.01.1.1]|nr:hypothetical protein EOA29_31265 [Mesorhizobium sp. M1E.F.Ca.ET.063.01.1.1]